MTAGNHPPKMMPPGEACCTCASMLCRIAAAAETETEKPRPYPDERRLQCCSRVICGKCIHNNPRFATYCPYCQIATCPSNSLPRGLVKEQQEPPSYDFATTTTSQELLESSSSNENNKFDDDEVPPPYNHTTTATITTTDEKKATFSPPDTLHFLHPTHDTVASLSLRYGVPAAALRRHNNLTSDHLLAGRKTILIPGAHYPSGVSLSPRPVGGEIEDARKAKIRRWMVACKCAEYDVAELYLEAGGYDLGLAVESYLADEEWERLNPLESGKGKGKGKGNGMAKGGGKGGTRASQAAFLRRQGPS